jgi:hypothetical protein
MTANINKDGSLIASEVEDHPWIILNTETPQILEPA